MARQFRDIVANICKNSAVVNRSLSAQDYTDIDTLINRGSLYRVDDGEFTSVTVSVLLNKFLFKRNINFDSDLLIALRIDIVPQSYEDYLRNLSDVGLTFIAPTFQEYKNGQLEYDTIPKIVYYKCVNGVALTSVSREILIDKCRMYNTFLGYSSHLETHLHYYNYCIRNNIEKDINSTRTFNKELNDLVNSYISLLRYI